MVKGTTQRVVVVRAKGGALFDEAIFLIRPGMEQECAVTDQMLLDEARRAAAPELGRAADWKTKILFALGGAGVTGLCWVSMRSCPAFPSALSASSRRRAGRSGRRLPCAPRRCAPPSAHRRAF